MEIPPFIQTFIDGPKPPKIALGVLGIVFLLIAGWFVVLSPEHAQIAALNQKNAALHVELVQNRAAVAELARFRLELAEFERKLAVLQDKLPTERETPVVYRSVSDAAHEAGLGVALFQPRESVPKDYVNEIPITISAEGGYHQLGDFFGRVARLPRVVTVGELKLTGLAKSRSTLKADITLATYTYRPPTPGAGPRPAAPAPAKPTAAVTTEGRAHS